VPLAWAYWDFPAFDQQRLGSYYVRGHVLLIAAALAGARLDTIRSDATVRPWIIAFLIVVLGSCVLGAITPRLDRAPRT
jgi:heme A synthase